MGIIFMKQQLRIIAEWRRMHEENSTDGIAESVDPVSYTHLTLPTIA